MFSPISITIQTKLRPLIDKKNLNVKKRKYEMNNGSRYFRFSNGQWMNGRRKRCEWEAITLKETPLFQFGELEKSL